MICHLTSRVLRVFVVLFGFVVKASAGTVAIEGDIDSRWSEYSQLLHTLPKTGGNQQVRILQLGDSHTANPFFSDRIRQNLQARFGNAGPGFLPPGPIKDMPVPHVTIRASARWMTSRMKTKGKYLDTGLGGYEGWGYSAYQMVSYAPKVSTTGGRIILYSSHAQGGMSPIKLYWGQSELISGDISAIKSTKTPVVQRQAFSLPKVQAEASILAPTDFNDLRFNGLNWFADFPGVVYSNIGIVGAHFDILQDWSSDLTRAQLQDFAPNLVILAFGTNDSWNMNFDTDRFKSTLNQLSDWMNRYVPNAAVLVIFPPNLCIAPKSCVEGPVLAKEQDRCTKGLNAQIYLTRGLLRQTANSNRWRIWDWSGLLAQECERHKEKLYSSDGVHLTRIGYEISGNALSEELTR